LSYIDEKQKGLLVVAFPELSDKDRLWIENFREKYDKLFYKIIEPHFTLVFPTFKISVPEFTNEIRNLSRRIKRFEFILKSAMMNNDLLSDYYHIFLIPDKGNSNIVKAHDILYSGILKKTRKTEIDFVSHLGIGNTKNPEECIKIVENINNSDISIKGYIKELTIISYGDRKIEIIEKIPI
jgi:hypothetical protein